MGTQRVTFHFADTQTALICTAARGLMRPYLFAPLATRIDLVLRQMLQTHEIQRTHENRRLNLLTGYTGI